MVLENELFFENCLILQGGNVRGYTGRSEAFVWRPY